MAWEAIAGGVASIGGALLQNEANAKEAKKNRAFQERMSNTSHQREVKDLIAAGLNPILSANAGASTPAGSTATYENALGAGVSSAVEAYRSKLDTERLKADIAKQKTEISLMNEQKKETSARTQKTRTETEIARKWVPLTTATDAVVRKTKEMYDTGAKKVKGWIDDKNYMEKQRKGLP